MMAVLLFAALLLVLAGCASGRSEDTSEQPAEEENPVSQTPEVLLDEEILETVYNAQVLRNILAQHENVLEDGVYYDARGNVAQSFCFYADSERYVNENSDPYLYIQTPDGFFIDDPATKETVQVGFGMDGLCEAEWEARMDDYFDFYPDADDTLTEVAVSDGRMILTLVSAATEENSPYMADEIEPGDLSVCKAEVDTETFLVYDVALYLRKPDGTELKSGETRISYDVAPYEPSEEMLRVMNGTDKKITLIADPGTEREKTYVKTCGENGSFAVLPADGYKKFYLDEACTQESAPTDESERTIYTRKES